MLPAVAGAGRATSAELMDTLAGQRIVSDLVARMLSGAYA
ncbi:conserved hypothetical protein [Cupriavidus taiwanensis]|nr:conserved hypothetical protein [Cupriavidus taiwanensis]SPA36527.1 conserved hypothetical protein [Cupriavidus taiwanensis]